MHRSRPIRWALPGFGGSKLLDIPADFEAEDREASILRLLAEPGRLRVVAALVLGYERPPEIASATGMGEGNVGSALVRLAAGGLVLQIGDGGYRFAIDELKKAVRRAPSGEEELRDASAEQRC
jgi:DNA-binding transcriptional ArsR family regulator